MSNFPLKTKLFQPSASVSLLLILDSLLYSISGIDRPLSEILLGLKALKELNQNDFYAPD